ncbi:MAG: hypothetical protein L0387_29035, partial [Acidobacteria bacterium]|nr:hypothetical protein [Acidobacteriota bacterium]
SARDISAGHLYFKDTDGDGRADSRKVIFTGFAMANSEARITNLRYGLDNWIYAANSGQPGDIASVEVPGMKTVSVSGADFRFRLDRNQFEAESGNAQFGVALDDWGNRFITQNTVHVQHVVIPRRYLNRNPYLISGSPSQDISDHGKPSARMFPETRPEEWRERRTQMRQQRYQENRVDRIEIAGGFFTAASGGTIYGGDQFPGSFRGSLFTGDVSGNLVHRDILHPEGASFVASRADSERDREFLASTDPWFRPCNFANGPDGNLYVVDMYREIIEGPDFIPEELKKGVDFYSGDTLGRIYRVVPKEAPSVRRVETYLDKAPSTELVRFLSHPNVWWRLTAQRLIVERQDRSLAPALREASLHSDSPPAQIHSLYALEGLNSLDASVIRPLLKSPRPEVREHAVRLAEGFPELARDLIALSRDPAVRVCFQVALSLGQFSGKEMARALAQIASIHLDDGWFRTAILSSPVGSSLELLKLVVGERVASSEGMASFLKEISSVVGARRRRGEIEGILALLDRTKPMQSKELRTAVFSGLARGLSVTRVRGLKNPLAERLISRALADPSEGLQTAARELARHFDLAGFVANAEREALDAALSVDRRERAVQSLGGASFFQMKRVFERLVAQPLEPSLLKSLITSIAGFDDSEVANLLIKNWNRLGPGARDTALDRLLNHRDRAQQLLTALDKRQIETAALTPARREKLLQHPDDRVRRWAARSLTLETSEREAIVERYRPSLSQIGDVRRGRSTFEKHCATCHWPKGGHQVGPDLSGVSSNTKAQLLQSILDPSKTVEPRYRNYIVIDKEGRIHDGLIVAETSGAITMRSGEVDDHTVLRSMIAEMRASSVSLMPEGFEKSIDLGSMTDLIAFLQGGDLQKH